MEKTFAKKILAYNRRCNSRGLLAAIYIGGMSAVARILVQLPHLH